MNTSSTAGRDGAGPYYEYRGRPRWRPLEVAAVVVGFILYWPIGLGLLLWKLWRTSRGETQDFVSVARGAFRENVMSRWPDMSRGWGCGARRQAARDWGFASPGWRSSTGNAAFDEWRDAELARLEEERRKLEAAEREFAEHMENLRKAKDREEFERWRSQRGAGGESPRQ